jgi:choline dehydrogenase-like flavoprotein
MEYDVIIVGSGAGGGIAAGVLAEAGKRVLLLERGRNLAWKDVARDHLRNHRNSVYGHNTGPDLVGNPRVLIDAEGGRHVIAPHQGGYSNNAVAVGGGTLVYGAQAWRFMPQDFCMASLYGVPDGSSLADWPLAYEDLEPDYDRAEWEIGCCGSPNPLHGPRRRGYPMPPIPDNASRLLLKSAAEKLGWNASPVPMLINTAGYNGRAACIQCGTCAGFACPSDSKNGSQNTMIRRALASGNCQLVAQAMAQRIETDARGKVNGVTYFSSDGQKVSARAKTVVVSGGAIETARLLLNSRSDHHPNGLGNRHDQVGRHLQGHYYPEAMGLFDEKVMDCVGPGVSIATCQFNHNNPGLIGGGMLCNQLVKPPIIFWKQCFPPGTKQWGAQAKRYMRENYLRLVNVLGPVHEIPVPDARVTIDPEVRDHFGNPVARLSGSSHDETVRVSRFMADKAEQWLKAAGAKKVWSVSPGKYLSAGQHQSGTCRMGNDPKTSVTDSFGRVHGHENLFVADASLHVTNGGFNPVLTIMALAFRVSRRIGAIA